MSPLLFSIPLSLYNDLRWLQYINSLFSCVYFAANTIHWVLLVIVFLSFRMSICLFFILLTLYWKFFHLSHTSNIWIIVILNSISDNSMVCNICGYSYLICFSFYHIILSLQRLDYFLLNVKSLYMKTGRIFWGLGLDFSRQNLHLLLGSRESISKSGSP